MERYILNEQHHTVHDREKLTERCNTDDIMERRELEYEELEQLRNRGPLFACMLCMPFGLPGAVDMP